MAIAIRESLVAANCPSSGGFIARMKLELMNIGQVRSLTMAADARLADGACGHWWCPKVRIFHASAFHRVLMNYTGTM
jgi:hypothetical protein